MVYVLANLLWVPPVEEILFRYGMYGKFLKPKLGASKAAILVTLAFTGLHFVNDAFVVGYALLIFLSGILLILCYEYYGLRGAILAHYLVLWGGYLRIQFGVLPLLIAIPVAVIFVAIRIKREGLTLGWKK